MLQMVSQFYITCFLSHIYVSYVPSLVSTMSRFACIFVYTYFCIDIFRLHSVQIECDFLSMESFRLMVACVPNAFVAP